MSYFRSIFILVLFMGCSSVLDAHTSGTTAENTSTQNFVYFARDRERITDKGFLETKKLEGAQLLYGWNELEPEEDNYDFTEIQKDLEFLQSKGKKLFIQLQVTTFNASRKAVPKYVTTESKYKGGVVFQYDEKEKPAGNVAMLWNPMVRDRFQKLLIEIGKNFDGKIEGIALQETAIDIELKGRPLPEGFTYPSYRDAILSNMDILKQSFTKSTTIQYANFMPGEWLPDDDHSYLRSIFDYAQKIGVGVGAPDLMPKKPSYNNHAYKFIRELTTQIPVGIAVQDGNYGGKTNDDSKPGASWPNLVPQLSNFAKTELRTKYIFWGAQEPYFTHDVVPYFQ